MESNGKIRFLDGRRISFYYPKGEIWKEGEINELILYCSSVPYLKRCPKILDLSDAKQLGMKIISQRLAALGIGEISPLDLSSLSPFGKIISVESFSVSELYLSLLFNLPGYPPSFFIRPQIEEKNLDAFLSLELFDLWNNGSSPELRMAYSGLP